MRVLITGATGAVGRFITRDLLDAGYEVTLLGRARAEAAIPVGPAFLDWQLGMPVDLPPAAALVHAALDHVPGAYRGGEGADPEGFWRRNFDGSVQLFEAAMAQGVRRVVFLSSRAVYGGAQTVLRESDAPEPETLYGQLKHATERALAGLTRQGLSSVSLRATGVYGLCPGARGHKWQDLFATYLSGAPVAPRVATEVHGRDLAAAVRLALQRPSVTGPLNVSDLVLDRRDLLAQVRELTGCPYPLPPAADRFRLAVMATDRLRALGWQPGGLARLSADLPTMCDAVHA
ncbi:MAG: NAD(P)-dependent oxidoreductase [Amaricoccus sp.]